MACKGGLFLVDYSLISKRIRELIEESGLTLRELEKEIGVNNATLSQWQQGRKKPHLDSLLLLAEYFNVSGDWLLGVSDTKKVDASVRGASELTRLSSKAVATLSNKPTFKPLSPEEAEALVKSGNVELRAWSDSECLLLSEMIEDGSLLKIVSNIDQYLKSMKFDKAKRQRFIETGECEEGMTVGTLPGGKEIVTDTVFSKDAEIYQHRAEKAVTMYTEKRSDAL